MSGTSSRRDFLVTASLAGGALAAGGGTGCGGGKSQQEIGQSPEKQQVRVDSLGRLVVEDPALAKQLNDVWMKMEGASDPPDSLHVKGITVLFTGTAAGAEAKQTTEPRGQASRTGTSGTTGGSGDNPAGKQVNSLCFCGPARG